MLFGLIISLINRLSASLHATEQALAERDRLNDTLEQRVAERTTDLRVVERQLQLILRTIPDELWFKDREGRYLLVSDVLAAASGHTPAEMIGRRAAELFASDLVDVIDENDRQVIEQGQSYAGEWRLLDRDGNEQWFDGSRTPVVDESGVIIGQLGMARNVNERKRAEAALLQAKEAAESADRAKSAFLAMMSHEIRTPLNAVIGMTSLLLDSDLSDEQREFVDTIRMSGNALLALINDILDISRIEAGQVVLEERPFSLIDCLNEALSLVMHQAQRKRLALRDRIVPGLPALLYGDPTRLGQIVTNLLSNAVKFTLTGEVILEAQSRPEADGRQGIMISVRDTGIGIAPDQLTRIFQPFVQADSSTTRRYGGTGLGLAISRQLTELMGGTLTATSTLGVGSCFTLSLSLRGAAEVAASAQPARANSSHASELLAGQPPGDDTPGLRLLLAEDNPINQIVTLRLLERLGHQADIVTNGHEAVESVIHQAYDVVLMDVQMPDLDGEQATRRIRAYGVAVHQPYIVALTAYALVGDRERIMAAGMDAYLSKPVQLDDLRTVLAQALGRRLM